MTHINGVLGPIDTKDLGFTYIHEHLLIGWAGWQEDPFVTFDRAEGMARAVDMLLELKSLGVGTFVDPCNADMGRDAEYMAEAAEKSGMQIVASTGLYHHELGIPAHYHALTEEELAEVFIHDITEGIGNTGIKAGIIKTATTAGKVTDQEAKVHRAAARAHKAAGAPILTHTDEAAPMGLAQLDLFEERGANFDGVAIGHSCGGGNIRYLLDVLKRGAMLSFDRFGFGISASDDVRIAALLGLIGLGYTDRVMLSHDSVSGFLGRGFNPPPEIAAALADWNPAHLIKNIFPRLKEAGVSQETLDTIMIENPRRYFEAAAGA
jgi:phosphotriesterase-related protein